MSRGRKIATVVLIVIAIIVVALVLVIPRLIDLDRYRPEIVATLEQRTGRPVEIARLQLTFLPRLALGAKNVALGNPAGFPQGYLVEIARVDAELDARALWHRQIAIESLKLDRPVIHLVSTPDGRWNFENPAPARIRKAALQQDSSAFSLGVISKISLSGADLTAARLLPSGRADAPFFEMRDLSAELNQVDLASFGLSASRASVADAILEVVESQGEPGASAAQGNLEAKSLRYGSIEATRLKSRLALGRREAELDGLGFDFYDGRGQGDVALDFSGANLRYRTNIKLRDVNMTPLLAAFPGARGKLAGKMTGELVLTGENTDSADPLAGKTGHGTLTIRDGRLPTLDLNKNLLQLADLIRGGSSGDPSAFSSLTADLEIAGGRISSRSITVAGSAVDIDAHGSLSLAGPGNLDYQGVAKIAARSSQLTNLLGGLLGSKVTGGKLTVPFALAGTLDHPRFLMRSGPLRSRSGVDTSIRFNAIL